MRECKKNFNISHD